MIRILTFAIISLPLILNGQTSLSGRYCDYGNGYGGECIIFSKDNKFELNGSSCFGEYLGKGKYELKNDTLTLTFLNQEKKANEAKVLKKSISNSDSVEIQVKVVDKENNPVPFAQITLYKSFPTDSEKAIKEFESDIDGNANVNFHKSDKLNFIKIWFVGRKPIVQELKLGFNYNLKAEINMSSSSYLTSGQWSFKIIIENSNLIKLDRLEWEEVKFVDYKK